MKLLTINTHSLIETNYEEKCKEFVGVMSKYTPDVIAMQEVNQTIDAIIAENSYFYGDIPLRKDNHALKIQRLLETHNLKYHMIWLGIKQGYGKFDEGLAFLTRNPIQTVKSIQISNCNDYKNWKTRKGLIIKCGDDWFCNVHMGWWDDVEEPFINQWKRVNNELLSYDNMFLMGDFNSPASIRNEGYDKVCSSGWVDTYNIAREKDEGYTVFGKIAGWSNASTSNRMRIDYIFAKQKENVISSVCLFNNVNGKQISDHCAVMIDVERESKLL